jgi:putative FmdB family regulatory protein
MPVYTFRCQKCDAQIEVEHGFSEPHPTRHKGCRGALKRLFVSPEIVYKVQGFYSVDKRLDTRPEDAE